MGKLSNGSAQNIQEEDKKILISRKRDNPRKKDLIKADFQRRKKSPPVLSDHYSHFELAEQKPQLELSTEGAISYEILRLNLN